MTEWRVIPHYPLYEVSDRGEVRGPKGLRKLSPVSKGYVKVALFNEKGRLDIPVHILVCQVFNGPKPYPEANALHKNNIRDDNRPDNLYWGTAKDNADDRIRSGIKTGQIGEDHHRAKLTWVEVNEIRQAFKSRLFTQFQLACKYKVTQATISLIILNKSWIDNNYQP